MIKPKDITLYNTIDQLLKQNNCIMWGVHQYHINNFIINVDYKVTECLLLDNFGNVIDGFVNDRQSHLTYKGYEFFDILYNNIDVKNLIEEKSKDYNEYIMNEFLENRNNNANL